MHDACLKIAENAEKQMERIYLSVSIEAILIEITAIAVILYFLPLTAFTVIQAIGATLLILLIASIVIMIRKKSVKKQLCHNLEQSGVSEETLKKYLEAHATEYELIRTLFKDKD